MLFASLNANLKGIFSVTSHLQKLILISICLILSCKGQHQTNEIIESLKSVKSIPSLHQQNTFGMNDSIMKLQGIWAENAHENAIFYIKKDSLYYVEFQNRPIKFKLKKNTLILMGDVPANCEIIKLTYDTLWYKDEFSPNLTKLYKRH